MSMLWSNMIFPLPKAAKSFDFGKYDYFLEAEG